MPEWEPVCLGEVLSISHGFAFKGEFFCEQGDLIVLTPGNFREEGGFKPKSGKEKYYKGPVPDGFLLEKSQVVVAMTEQSKGLLGSSATIPAYNKYLHNQRIGLVRITDTCRLDLRFAYHLMNAPYVRQQIQATATGSKVRHTAPKRIESVVAPLPSIRYQRQIGRTLDNLEDLVENNRRRIKVLEKMARLLYREWFVHFRFPGYEEVKFIDSALGPIPEGWEVSRLAEACSLVMGQSRLAEACSLVMGQSPKSEYYNDVGEGLPFHQRVTDFGKWFPTHTRWTTVQKRVGEPGDILFSVRAPVGRINTACDRLVVGRGLCAIRALDEHQTFLLMQLKNKFAVEDSIGGGTIFNAVTKKDMESIMLLKPTSSVVGGFEAAATPMANLVANLSRQNVVLSEARDPRVKHPPPPPTPMNNRG